MSKTFLGLTKEQLSSTRCYLTLEGADKLSMCVAAQEFLEEQERVEAEDMINWATSQPARHDVAPAYYFFLCAGGEPWRTSNWEPHCCKAIHGNKETRERFDRLRLRETNAFCEAGLLDERRVRYSAEEKESLVLMLRAMIIRAREQDVEEPSKHPETPE